MPGLMGNKKRVPNANEQTSHSRSTSTPPYDDTPTTTTNSVASASELAPQWEPLATPPVGGGSGGGKRGGTRTQSQAHSHVGVAGAPASGHLSSQPNAPDAADGALSLPPMQHMRLSFSLLASPRSRARDLSASPRSPHVCG